MYWGIDASPASCRAWLCLFFELVFVFFLVGVGVFEDGFFELFLVMNVEFFVLVAA